MSQALLTAVRSLTFDEDRSGLLGGISSDRWTELLALTDSAHMTPALAARCGHAAPEPVRRQLESCLARSSGRHASVVKAHVEIAATMNARKIPFVVLKGLTHTGFWNSDSRLRPQYDIDLYVPPEAMSAASAAMASLGYQGCETGKSDTDHLPVMVRRTGWRWRGDYYDPNQPLALELHFRFWSPGLGFVAQGAENFWNRRTEVEIDGVILPALHPVDRLRYAAWHALRHLLHGSLRILHIYELAHFLHYSADAHEFWEEWRAAGAPADRLAESIVFRLAFEWLGCRMNPISRDYMGALPVKIERWFDLFAFSPITGVTRPNKDELFLSLCLVENIHRGREVAARRLLPWRLPTFVLDAHDQTVNFPLRMRRGASRSLFIVNRALHHLRAMPSLIGSAVRWWLSSPSRVRATAIPR